MKLITPTIFLLSMVSLFTDIASEMLYPVMPIYLKSIGFSILLIGVLEGFAEAIAGLSKGYFGKKSDTIGKRLPFVQIGYFLSAISKPLLVVFTFPIWIFLSRTIDRLGKGIRTGARDALLSDEATKETKGRVFGFHRSMDTFGAVVGPLFALLYLAWKPEDYKTLFYISIIPGVLAISFTFFLKEKAKNQVLTAKKVRFFDFLTYWKQSPLKYRKLVLGLLVFALFNSSDVFLLLKIKEAGFDDVTLIGVYIFYNFIYAFFAFPLGSLADKLGMKKVFVGGLFLFAFVYLGMAFASQKEVYFLLFFIYGIYAAATDGISKAWISTISAKENTATAIGTYAAFQSLAALFSSAFAGLIWFVFGANPLFIFSGLATLIVAFYFIFRVKSEN